MYPRLVATLSKTTLLHAMTLGGYPEGRVAAVEVKLAASVAQHDLKGLASLRDALGDHFVRGVIVYTGLEVMPMGDRILAVPLAMMFSQP